MAPYPVQYIAHGGCSTDAYWLIHLHQFNIEKLHAGFSPSTGSSPYYVWLLIVHCHYFLTTFFTIICTLTCWNHIKLFIWPSTWGSFMPPCISVFLLYNLENFYSSFKIHLLSEMFPEVFRQKESSSSLFKHSVQHVTVLSDTSLLAWYGSLYKLQTTQITILGYPTPFNSSL